MFLPQSAPHGKVHWLFSLLVASQLREMVLWVLKGPSTDIAHFVVWFQQSRLLHSCVPLVSQRLPASFEYSVSILEGFSFLESGSVSAKLLHRAIILYTPPH